MRGILLSGGMDSSALACWKRPDVAFNINYGQLSAKAERNAARKIANSLSIPLIEIDVDCSSLGSGDLAGKDKLQVGNKSDWWPYRNQLILTIAATKALVYGCKELMIGTVASDGEHLDGTQEFVEKINELISYQEGNLSITAPALNHMTEELIEVSGIPERLLLQTYSCHKANIPCFECRGCNKNQLTLSKLGKLDPA